jgi:hypothetical protein
VPVDLKVVGADQLARVSRALRDANAKDLKQELRRGLGQATKPLRIAAKANAAAVLPRRGGLGARVARTRMTTRIRTGGNPLVQIKAAANAVNDPLRIDRGRIRHPVWGRGPWVLQDVPKGWFTKPMQKGAPVVRPELIHAMDDVARKVARRS